MVQALQNIKEQILYADQSLATILSECTEVIHAEII